MILVIGGSGTTGRAVLERLSGLGAAARALVRPESRGLPDMPGVSVLRGHITDPTTIRTALTGVGQLFLAMGNGPDQFDLELTAVRQAEAAGVDHIVKVSGPSDGPLSPVAISRMHHRLEDAIRSCHTEFTFLRPYAFFQNLLNSAPVIRELGFFGGTTGSTAFNMVDVRDVADVAVAALTTDLTRNRVLELTGARTVSYPQVAELLTSIGCPTRYLDQHPAHFRDSVRRQHLPDWLVDHLLEIQALAVARPQTPTDTVARITGHAPREVTDFLRENVDQFRSTPRDAGGSHLPLPAGASVDSAAMKAS